MSERDTQTKRNYLNRLSVGSLEPVPLVFGSLAAETDISRIVT